MSIEGIHFMKKLCFRNEKNRISASEAVDHKWLKNKGRDKYIIELEAKALGQVLRYLKYGVMQRAVCKFFQERVMNNNETDLYGEVFNQINTKRDGQLTKQQIMKAFEKNRYKNVSELEIDKLFASCDDDGGGTLSFDEFF